MSIKSLSFQEIKKKADKLRELFQKFPSGSWSSFGSFIFKNEFAPLVGTICDEQIRSEDAWDFPGWLNNKLRTFDLSKLLSMDFEQLLNEYLKGKWPSGMSAEDKQKYLEKTSRALHEALGLFQQEKKTPITMFENREYSSLEVYFMLRRIPGIGPKKANMITRDFIYRSLDLSQSNPWFDQIKTTFPNFRVVDEKLLDMPIDVHVVKVFNRITGRFQGKWKEELPNHIQDILAFSKLAFPDMPAKLDQIFWTVGREYCHERNPRCNECPIAEVCDSCRGRK